MTHLDSNMKCTGKSRLHGSKIAVHLKSPAFSIAVSSMLTVIICVYPVSILHKDFQKKEASQQLDILFTLDNLWEG